MFFEKEKTLSYQNTRALLIRYMADYTNTQSPPKVAKKGWYALVTRDTGEVWLAETKSYASLIHRYHHGTDKMLPGEVKKAKEAGQVIELFLATKEGVDIDGLRAELESRDQLLDRAEKDLTSDGYIYVIRHDISMDYYLMRCRNKAFSEFDMLTRFYNHVQNMAQTAHVLCNVKLQEFVTKNAKDILNRSGFTSVRLDHFKNTDEAIAFSNQYVANCTKGTCLNNPFGKQ